MMATLNSPTVFANVGSLKKNMKLDFSGAEKKKCPCPANVVVSGGAGGGILASPDLAMLKMASPELEKMIMAQQHSSCASSSSSMSLSGGTPTQFLFPKNVTEEQEQYARGFLQALEQLQKTGPPAGGAAVAAAAAASTGVSSSSMAPSMVTVVDGCKAGTLPPSALGEYNLTMLSSTSSSSSSSSSSSTASSSSSSSTAANSSDPSPPFVAYSPPTSDAAASASSSQRPVNFVVGFPRGPVNLTQASNNNNNNNNGHSTSVTTHHVIGNNNVPAATLATSLPGASVLSLSQSQSQSQQQQQHQQQHQQHQQQHMPSSQTEYNGVFVGHSSSVSSSSHGRQPQPQQQQQQHHHHLQQQSHSATAAPMSLLVNNSSGKSSESQRQQQQQQQQQQHHHLPATSSSTASAAAAATVMIPQTVYAHERLLQLKSEPDAGCSSSSGAGSPPPSCMSPINMETQEKIKLERKRARNRLAATKCRKRKLDRISHLEGRVGDLKDTNVELSNAAAELRNQVSELKKQILQHCQSGCNISDFRDVV